METRSAIEFTEVTHYINVVVLDGRYLDDFQDEPYQIARRLGVEISPSAIETITASQRDDLLSSLYNAKFNIRTRSSHDYIPSEDATADIGTTVAVGILAGVVVIAIAAIVVLGASSVGKGTGIDDRSPDRDKKL